MRKFGPRWRRIDQMTIPASTIRPKGSRSQREGCMDNQRPGAGHLSRANVTALTGNRRWTRKPASRCVLLLAARLAGLVFGWRRRLRILRGRGLRGLLLLLLLLRGLLLRGFMRWKLCRSRSSVGVRRAEFVNAQGYQCVPRNEL